MNHSEAKVNGCLSNGTADEPKISESKKSDNKMSDSQKSDGQMSDDLDEETDSSDDTLPTEQMNIRLETGEVELTYKTFIF